MERDGGVETRTTAWVPAGKPIWLTEIGVPGVDKGTNGPNVFPDPKSSESAHGAHRVGDAPAGDVRRAAVHRFKDRNSVADISTRGDAEAAEHTIDGVVAEVLALYTLDSKVGVPMVKTRGVMVAVKPVVLLRV